ncbi:MAG: ribosome biogenesis GTP-binding protein YihA/YsxC [Peptococcaceae bacterium]|jgi:GTP-binding protein|nr:ribosome biogenesis GTP-binding protein YihA/YsxC [Peptococcaceae bacterium]
MIIREAAMFAAAVRPEQYPPGGRPEIALSGRSNVGKSSLINNLLQRKNLARTSGQPGKTQTLNFYAINQAWFFVDLPGYGYAKTSKTDRARWGQFIEAYLTGREELAGVIQLVDFRHPPMESDQLMVEWLRYQAIPFVVAGSKADKLPKGRWQKQVGEIRRELALAPATAVIPFSAETGQGREELAGWLTERLTARSGGGEKK